MRSLVQAVDAGSAEATAGTVSCRPKAAMARSRILAVVRLRFWIMRAQ
jgi:hypothetical protein